MARNPGCRLHLHSYILANLKLVLRYIVPKVILFSDHSFLHRIFMKIFVQPLQMAYMEFFFLQFFYDKQEGVVNTTPRLDTTSLYSIQFEIGITLHCTNYFLISDDLFSHGIFMKICVWPLQMVYIEFFFLQIIYDKQEWQGILGVDCIYTHIFQPI